jgi:hypothetical protein
VSLLHPYERRGGEQWFKGSLHVHSEVSPVGEEPQRCRTDILDDYRQSGHDFVMFAEQNRYTPQGEIDATHLNDHGIVIVPGAELDPCWITTGHHVSHVNPSDGCEVTECCSVSTLLAYIAADDNALSVLLHPNYDPGFSMDHDWSALTAIEVISGYYLRRWEWQVSPFAFHAWDQLLLHGIEVWGVADDCSFGNDDVNVAWLQVFAQECSVASIVGAVGAGRFYGSTGPTIEAIEVEDMTVSIVTTDAACIRVVVDGAKPEVVAEGPAATYEVAADASYVRFECVGAEDTWGSGYAAPWTGEHVLSRAWTQPFRVAE